MQYHTGPEPRTGEGFTLIELMVAVAITGVISLALVQMLQVGERSGERNRILVDMQQNARVGLDALSDDLRHVSYGKDATQPSISYAGPDSVSFVYDVDPDHVGAEVISFFLSPDGDPDTPNPNDTVLMKVVADSSGVPIYAAPQAYGIKADGLSFDWYNGGGVQLPNPVPQPEQVGEIFVSLTASGARPLGGEYPDLTISSTIYPRNLPLSPARSRPNTPGCSPLTFPNCESATLEWTTPTTNTDGTELPLTDISHFSLYFGTDPDNLSLYTKLARTINEWTISDLTDPVVYYIAVTCVSRSGVESYRCTQSADMSSPDVPEAPATLNVNSWLGGGVHLTWPAVTSFVSGDPITTPVTYAVYRDISTGFTPDDDNRIATVAFATEFADTGMTNCATYYYVVQARACGNEGDPSIEVSGSRPAPPSAPTGVVAEAVGAGEVLLSWMRPANRMDGTSLDPADITGYEVYADTVPGNTTFLTDVSGNVTSTVLSGLIACEDYYVNLRCLDSCGHAGDLSPANETHVFTASPCDPEPPTAPATLLLTEYDDRVGLEWPANQVDCDVHGYNIYYGVNQGGPYDGSGADQGPSPVHVESDAVTVGDVCRMDLTGLEECQTYAVMVRATDSCEPPNQSAPSPEASGRTSCTPCQIASGCTVWAVDGTGDTDLHLEVFTTNAGGETMTRITPEFAGDSQILQVLYGRPLVPIWSSDGTAGEDGNVGPQGSGSTLDIDNTTIPSWTDEGDGQPLVLVFDSDIRNVPVDLAFRGLSGQCSATGSGSGAARVEDFDDGNYYGWSEVSGNWVPQNGEAWQTLTNGYYVLRANGLTLGDLTMEAKLLVSGGNQRSAYLVYRYQDPNNYCIAGIRTSYNQVLIARVRNGSFNLIGSYSVSLSDNQWYTLRVVATGDRIRAWLDCRQIIDTTDYWMWSSGGVGLATRRGSAKFDDVKILAGAVLP